MKSILLIYFMCMVLSVILQAVEEQQERYKNDTNRSPKERDRAYHRYEFARTIRKILPIISSIFLILYIISDVI